MMNVENPSCVLYGPPGAGKTVVAEELARLLGLNHVIEEWHHSSDVFLYRHHLYVTNVGHVPASLFENGGRAYSVEEAKAYLDSIKAPESGGDQIFGTGTSTDDVVRYATAPIGSAEQVSAAMTRTRYADPILNERERTYGDYVTQAAFSQKLKELVRDRHPADMTPAMRETMDMICVKISRILHGDPAHRDSWVDIAGYANLIAENLAHKAAP